MSCRYDERVTTEEKDAPQTVSTWWVFEKTLSNDERRYGTLLGYILGKNAAWINKNVHKFPAEALQEKWMRFNLKSGVFSEKDCNAHTYHDIIRSRF